MCAEKITISDIKSAEKLLGITYSKSEREQMVQNLEGQILSAKLRRGIELDNTTPMASKFDPRLPGFQMPSRSDIKLQKRDIKLPKNKEDIAFASIGEQGKWIKDGLLTSRKLTEIYLERIESFESKLECFATVTKDQALAEADAMDLLTSAKINLGPLHGIPYGLKDLFDTKGVRTGWGAEPYQNRVPV